jgi:hypothetical protein
MAWVAKVWRSWWGWTWPIPGSFGDPFEDAADLVSAHWATVPDDQPVNVVIAGCLVVVEEFDQPGMEGDVAVVVEFPQRDSQPMAAFDLGDGIGGEGTEFTDP